MILWGCAAAELYIQMISKVVKDIKTVMGALYATSVLPSERPIEYGPVLLISSDGSISRCAESLLISAGRDSP